MYQNQLGDGQQNLGFSLPRQVKPPSWLRKIVGAAVSGSTVTVQTPSGPQVFSLSSAADLARLKAMVTGARIDIAPGQKPSLVDQASDALRSFPGGGVGLGALVLGALLVLRKGNR